MGSSAFKNTGNSDRPPGGAMPARHANPKIIAIGDAIAKRKKSLAPRMEAEAVSNIAEFIVEPPVLNQEVKEVLEETDHPFVVAQWVAPHTPCIIRSVDHSSCIRAIVYPGQKKRREFFYSADRLIRVETEEGELRVTYSYDPYADEWLMIHDGITARMQGEVRLTEAGVLQIEIDQSGSARLEYPDGAVKLANNCFEPRRKKLSVPEMEFLNVVSHDLRSPLMSIQGLMTLLTSGALGDISERARNRINGVETEVARLIRLVNELLEAGLINHQKEALVLETVPVNELFDATIFALENLAARKSLVVEYAPVSYEVEVNVDSFIRVLVNLLANAVKYSPEGETIRLSAVKEDDHITLSVEDYGKGISEANFERIFQSFQSDTEKDNGNESDAGNGIGLGLAICKSIVEAHGGSIGIKSKPGEGSTFWIRLPQ